MPRSAPRGASDGLTHGPLRSVDVRSGGSAERRPVVTGPAASQGQRVFFCANGRITSMFVVSTKDGPVSTGQATTDVVAVLHVEVERLDGEVALHVGLLVDRELDLAVLDRLGRVDVEVEGDELGVAAGRVDGLERVEGDRGAEGDDVVDRLVLRQLGLQGRDDRRVVGAVDLDVLGGRDAVLDTGAPGLERDRPGGLDHAEHLLAAVIGDPLAGRLAGEVLVGPEVHLRADLPGTGRCRS